MPREKLRKDGRKAIATDYQKAFGGISMDDGFIRPPAHPLVPCRISEPTFVGFDDAAFLPGVQTGGQDQKSTLALEIGS